MKKKNKRTQTAHNVNFFIISIYFVWVVKAVRSDASAGAVNFSSDLTLSPTAVLHSVYSSVYSVFTAGGHKLHRLTAPAAKSVRAPGCELSFPSAWGQKVLLRRRSVSLSPAAYMQVFYSHQRRRRSIGGGQRHSSGGAPVLLAVRANGREAAVAVMAAVAAV